MNKLRPSVIAVILFFSLATQLRSEILMKDYLKLKNTKEIELFLTGYLEGVTWANSWLNSQKRPLIFCEPFKLALNTANIKQIVDNHYERKKLMYENILKEDIYFGAIAFFALQEAFPCK